MGQRARGKLARKSNVAAAVGNSVEVPKNIKNGTAT